jgi:hypothetical protein
VVDAGSGPPPAAALPGKRAGAARINRHGESADKEILIRRHDVDKPARVSANGAAPAPGPRAGAHGLWPESR